MSKLEAKDQDEVNDVTEDENSEENQKTNNKIGGDGKLVEMDETYFGRRFKILGVIEVSSKITIPLIEKTFI